MAEAFKEIRRVCRDDARVVFTYQNLDGNGWAALANAMGEGGVLPIKAFPLLGDCGSRLHKREKSISWDAVVVCKVGWPQSCKRSGKIDPELGRSGARAWGRKIQAAGLDFTRSDEENIAYAEAIVRAAANWETAPTVLPKARIAPSVRT